MRELILELEEQIKVTEDVAELKRLQSQRDKLAVAIEREDELTLELETLRTEHTSLKDDYVKAVRHSVVSEKNAPKGDEPKSDQDIYDSWKEAITNG